MLRPCRSVTWTVWSFCRLIHCSISSQQNGMVFSKWSSY